jgi:hypothetical protein
MSLLERTITALKEAATRPVLEEQELEEVLDHVLCGTPINEKWSDAARAASAAARKARARGAGKEGWMRAAADAYLGRKEGLKGAVKSAKKARANWDAVNRSHSGLLSPKQQKDYQRATSRLEQKVRRLDKGRKFGNTATLKVARTAGVTPLYTPPRRRVRYMESR